VGFVWEELLDVFVFIVRWVAYGEMCVALLAR
jgi:hypothetical protein